MVINFPTEEYILIFLIPLFTHSFNRYLLRAQFVPVTVLYALGNIAMSTNMDFQILSLGIGRRS